MSSGQRRALRRGGLVFVNAGLILLVAAVDSDSSSVLAVFFYLLVVLNGVSWLLCAALDRWSANFGPRRWWVLLLGEWLAFGFAFYGVAEGEALVGWILGVIRLADYALRMICPPSGAIASEVRKDA